MYYHGDGAPQSVKFAYIWLSIAAINRHARALDARDQVVVELAPELIVEAKKLTSRFYESGIVSLDFSVE